MDRRLTTLEATFAATLPHLATKTDVAETGEKIESVRSDIHRVESTFIKWIVGVAIAIVAVLIAFTTQTSRPQQIQPQPIIIQMPAPASAPAAEKVPETKK